MFPPIKLCNILMPPFPHPPPPPHWWLIGSKCSILPSLYSVGDDQHPLFPPENHEIPPKKNSLINNHWSTTVNEPSFNSQVNVGFRTAANASRGTHQPDCVPSPIINIASCFSSNEVLMNSYYHNYTIRPSALKIGRHHFSSLSYDAFDFE